MRRLKRTLVLLLAGVLCIVLAFVLRRHAPLPYVWAFPVFGMGCLALCLMVPGSIAQYAGIGLLSLALALGGGEAFLYFKRQSEQQAEAPARLGEADENVSTGNKENYRRYTENGRSARPTVPNEVTGYSPTPSSAIRAVTVANGNLVYDVVYTANERGWRITPQHPQATEAVVFFGCSYTFGDAVNDDETYPWQVAELLGEGYQVFNFGFSGYGAHQFLALLEAGVLEDITSQYGRTHVFFFTIPMHEYRAAGYDCWLAGAPWYEVVDNRPVRQGVLADKSGGFRLRLDKYFAKSEVYRSLFMSAHTAWDEPRSRALQEAIFKEGASICWKLPNTDFSIILWPGAEYNEAFLHAEAIPTLKLAGAFPADYVENKSSYIVVGDGHPNGHTNSFVAARIADYIRALSKR
ncbi:hypothetical protein LJB81_00805 [Desulfovibrio sp. OttesenSCG-928-M14]|nr:hypothetical protein [Desulfovibrio sp. OttesenSCG-928-M14]